MSAQVCFNPDARYCMIWRGDHRGAYYWITPASMRRLYHLLNCPAWQPTGVVGGEQWGRVQL